MWYIIAAVMLLSFLVSLIKSLFVRFPAIVTGFICLWLLITLMAPEKPKMTPEKFDASVRLMSVPGFQRFQMADGGTSSGVVLEFVNDSDAEIRVGEIHAVCHTVHDGGVNPYGTRIYRSTAGVARFADFVRTGEAGFRYSTTVPAHSRFALYSATTNFTGSDVRRCAIGKSEAEAWHNFGTVQPRSAKEVSWGG